MNIMVVGGGGREHAIIKKLKENPRVETIYALPGNGGIAHDDGRGFGAILRTRMEPKDNRVTGFNRD